MPEQTAFRPSQAGDTSLPIIDASSLQQGTKPEPLVLKPAEHKSYLETYISKAASKVTSN
jgi:hypothetical protein